MEKVFLQNSENIKDLIQLMILHEKNVEKHYATNEDSMNLDPIPPIPDTYSECEYGMLPTWAIYPRVIFKPEDPMIVIKKCGHSSRKEHFLQWIKDHNTCMECSTLLF